MTTRAYSQAQLDQMRADLRAIDAEVVHWEALAASWRVETRRRAQLPLRVWKAKQRSLAKKLDKIVGVGEKSR